MKSKHFASICTGTSLTCTQGHGSLPGMGGDPYGLRNFARTGWNRTMGAIDLEANGFFSELPPEVVDEEGNPVTVSETAQALPQMNGSGMVRNLRAAMSLSGTQADELEAAVNSFAAATTRDAQLDGLITEWAQTSSYWSSLELISEMCDSANIDATARNNFEWRICA